jgi:hypothetical protein
VILPNSVLEKIVPPLTTALNELAEALKLELTRLILPDTELKERLPASPLATFESRKDEFSSVILPILELKEMSPPLPPIGAELNEGRDEPESNIDWLNIIFPVFDEKAIAPPIPGLLNEFNWELSSMISPPPFEIRVVFPPFPY